VAVQTLRNAGLAVGTQESVSAPGVSPFVVTRQTPAAGSIVPRSGRVNLLYARPLRTLPVVTNQTLDDAIAELRASGFEPGLLTARPTDKAPPQQVLEQSHPAGVELEPGTKVDLVYAAPRPLPSTINLSIYYNTDTEREIAQNLSTHLEGYKFTGYRTVQIKGQTTLSPGVVHYARPEHERLAQSLASRAQAWLSKTYNRSIMLTPQLNPRGRGDLIVIYLPRPN
jgi:beta-lactam-binding protein with PASTA domain